MACYKIPKWRETLKPPNVTTYSEYSFILKSEAGSGKGDEIFKYDEYKYNKIMVVYAITNIIIIVQVYGSSLGSLNVLKNNVAHAEK